MAAPVSALNASRGDEFPVPPHDTKLDIYSGSNITSRQYRRGGETGLLVATVTYTYGGTAPVGIPYKIELSLP
jgi:hypothetical protein